MSFIDDLIIDGCWERLPSKVQWGCLAILGAVIATGAVLYLTSK